jgi:hypothetical protein
MKNKHAKLIELIRGAAYLSDMVVFLCKSKELMEKNIAHTLVYGIDIDEWCSFTQADWDASAIAVARDPSRHIVVIGEDGDVLVHAGENSTKEVLPSEARMIRNARYLDGKVFACGMQRQVFVRSADGQWTDISAPSGVPGEEVGFEAIDGYSAQEIYAVGWNGEIWQYDGAKWSNRGSLSNLTLTAVCCAPDGTVYAAGQQGMMIRGKGDVWAPIEWNEPVNDDLWDLCWFGDRLYVATATGLYTLNGNALEPVDFGDATPQSCFSLSAFDGVLWSVGPNDAVSFDGKRWRRYDN